jgi:two-component system LytT family response regulator
VHLLRETMSGMEDRLDPTRFLRIHRSTIINTERLRELRPYGNSEYIVVLDDGTELKLSRTYRDALDEFFDGAL